MQCGALVVSVQDNIVGFDLSTVVHLKLLVEAVKDCVSSEVSQIGA